MKKFVPLFVIFFAIANLTLAAVMSPQEEKPKKRVKRPTIDKSDSVYFKNLFADGLVGERPAIADKTKPQNNTPNTPNDNNSTPENTASFPWSKIISASVMESEMKNLSNQMNQFVTSPGKFKSGGNRDVRQASSMVAMLFGIIAEYDGDVKWKDISKGARDAFSQCAQSASTTSNQAYQQAKSRRDDLQQILSGGQFTSPVKPAEDFEWASVADVSELMKRLKVSYREKIKPWVGSDSEYNSNLDDLMHEAAMLAAIGEVLQKETMENADNDDYVEFCNSLKNGALMILNSKAAKDQEMAAKGAGMIDQSCQNCHADYN